MTFRSNFCILRGFLKKCQMQSINQSSSRLRLLQVSQVSVLGLGLITIKLSAPSTDGKAGQESTKIQLVFFYCLLQAGLVLILSHELNTDRLFLHRSCVYRDSSNNHHNNFFSSLLRILMIYPCLVQLY